jgi:predicted permease
MPDALLDSFVATFVALAKVFLVIAVAGLLVRRRILSQENVNGLSRATVVLFLPCLIFAKVVRTLEPSALPLWWALPLAGIVMSLTGLGLAALAYGPRVGRSRDMLAVASMQNAGYLILPVGLALYPDRFDTFALYTFLFILGFNPLLWSVGKALISGGRGSDNGWRGFVTPPLVASLAALGCVFSGLDRAIPEAVLSAVDLVGQAAVPVATVVLGAVLGSVRLRLQPFLGDAFRVLGVKLLLLPAATVALLWLLAVEAANPLLARFFILEAASAPAAALVLIVRTYGGDETRVGSVMLLAYAACAVSLPLWLAVWELVVG